MNDRGTGRGPGRESTLFLPILIGLFVVVAALSLFLLSGQRRRNALLLEYEAQKMAAALFEAFREGEMPETPPWGERILGFGVYSAGGVALRRAGSAPETLALPPRLSDVEFFPQPSLRHDRERRTLILIRPVGVPIWSHGWMLPRGDWGLRPQGDRIPPGAESMRPRSDRTTPRGDRTAPWMTDRMSPMSEHMSPMMEREARQVPLFVFLELSAGGFYARQRTLQVAQLLLPLVTLAAMAFVAVLYRNNQAIRRTLAAREQLARLGEASRTLTHEIKNPLSAIRIQTGVLRRTLPEDQHGELRVIDEEVRRLAVLTDRIGDFLRDPVGRPEPIDLDRFIRELALRYDRKIDYRGHEGEPVLVVFDSERLRSVLENLIGNALEAADGEAVEITAAATRQEAAVSVLDRGPGIPEVLRSKVYDPFFTSKVRGFGVGLAIARRFVEAAGGTLVLADREGGGTEARILLRRATA